MIRSRRARRSRFFSKAWRTTTGSSCSRRRRPTSCVFGRRFARLMRPMSRWKECWRARSRAASRWTSWVSTRSCLARRLRCAVCQTSTTFSDRRSSSRSSSSTSVGGTSWSLAASSSRESVRESARLWSRSSWSGRSGKESSRTSPTSARLSIWADSTACSTSPTCRGGGWDIPPRSWISARIST